MPREYTEYEILSALLPVVEAAFRLAEGHTSPLAEEHVTVVDEDHVDACSACDVASAVGALPRELRAAVDAAVEAQKAAKRPRYDLLVESLFANKKSPLPVHPVAAVGSGYVCLVTDAVYYVTLDMFQNEEKRKEVFAEWDRSHNAVHRVATAEEIRSRNAPKGAR